tara:strand:+ start:679 stop:1005 length:327 start_codon:yes stop_codon:yes gene_type:complete
MPRKQIKKETEKETPVSLDERFSLDSYDGIIGSLKVVAEGIANESLTKDKADLLLKVLSSARSTITEKRKTSAISNKAVDSAHNPESSSQINSSGPFAVYASVPGKAS